MRFISNKEGHDIPDDFHIHLNLLATSRVLQQNNLFRTWLTEIQRSDWSVAVV